MLIRKPRIGLTIAELLVACGLLGVVLVTVMTLFAQLLHNSEKNSLLSAGSFFADSVLEQHVSKAEGVLQAAPDNSTPAFPTSPLEGQGELAMADDKFQTEFLYRIDTQRVDSGASPGDPGQMWLVQVEVRWWNDDMSAADSTRAGYGKMSVKRSRLAYITRGD